MLRLRNRAFLSHAQCTHVTRVSIKVRCRIDQSAAKMFATNCAVCMNGMMIRLNTIQSQYISSRQVHIQWNDQATSLQTKGETSKTRASSSRIIVTHWRRLICTMPTHLARLLPFNSYPARSHPVYLFIMYTMHTVQYSRLVCIGLKNDICRQCIVVVLVKCWNCQGG